MDKATPSRRSRASLLFATILILTLLSMACMLPKPIAQFVSSSDKINIDTDIIEDQFFADVTPESILEEEQSYGSADDNPASNAPELPSIPDPATQECREAGYCVSSYPVDIRSTANPPDVMVWANAAEYPSPQGFSVTVSENAGPWYEWMVLREPGQFIQAVSPEGYTSLGIQFWGDDTNGWTRVTLDGVEVWRGDTTAYGSDGVNYIVYVEISGVDPGSHTLRAEVLGQPGKAGGENVPVFYFAYRR